MQSCMQTSTRSYKEKNSNRTGYFSKNVEEKKKAISLLLQHLKIQVQLGALCLRVVQFKGEDYERKPETPSRTRKLSDLVVTLSLALHCC